MVGAAAEPQHRRRHHRALAGVHHPRAAAGAPPPPLQLLLLRCCAQAARFARGGWAPQRAAAAAPTLPPLPPPPQLLGRLTKRHANAAQVAAAGGPRLLLSLPRACLGVQFWRLEPLLSAILRNLLEDPATLEGWMEAEIRSHLNAQVRRRGAVACAVCVGMRVCEVSRCR